MTAPTVRQLKKAAAELATALGYCGDYLAKQEGRGELATRAKLASDRLESLVVAGKESDPAPAAAVDQVAEAARIGREVLDSSDAGRKLPRVAGYIGGAETLLGPG